ncbi:hypothetical protein [Litorilituus lipolyticus]|uniref:Uncharacterized protein n=1 Tax=Litorilituus lipolyticus TaxID=2491017 RepID=A0A502L5I0_9GAMM|nr:hypothetical protein [Litorilituus lipolyticus]TPH17695.1 hypothetical protein EPA86_03855 [Litorilituus lipolyticus]
MQEDIDAILSGRKPNIAGCPELWFKDKRYAVTHKISVGLGCDGNQVQDDPTEDSNLLIQFAPKGLNMNFVRVDVNRNKSDWPFVVDHLTSIVGESIECIFDKCRITLLETTFDIYGVLHENLFVYGMSTSRGITHFDGGSNFYFGSNDSSRMYVHYDKEKHIKYLNLKRLADGKEALPEKPTTRIEIRHKRGEQREAITFHSALELHKHFSPISIFYVPKTSRGFTIEERLRLQLARHESLIVVTRKMKRGERDRFIQKLEKYKLVRFQEINFEEQLANALNRLVDF